MKILDTISAVINIFGITTLTWGSLLTFIKFLRAEFLRISVKENICKKREALRQHLGSYILLGLEFMIAADIIHTIIKPDKEGLIVLGSIVAIRTVISYFLTKELGNDHHCSEA